MSDAGETILSREPKILIAAFDGTASAYNSMNTNVVKFVSLLRKDTGSQLCYYQAGVGTYFSPGVVSPMFTWLAKFLDEAVAWYLDAHVMQGYKFLMDNYRPGDKICLFGFSRGAYAARALAGMLYKVGLLPKSNLQQVSFAYKAYKRTGKRANELAAGFKQTFSRDVKIEFVGVWDTVQSTGIIFNQCLPFTESNTLIKTFRQALALDEHRVKFRPNLYHRSRTDDPDPEYLSLSVSGRAHVVSENKASGRFGSLWNKLRKNKKVVEKPKFEGVKHVFTKKIMRRQSKVQIGAEKNGDTIVKDQTDLEAEASPDIGPEPLTDVLEVWFPGCHSDIGGGNVENSVKVSLAQNTLRWMVEQVILSQCGIIFDEEALERVGMPLSSFPVPPTSPVSEHLISKPQLMENDPGTTPEGVLFPVEELNAPSRVSSSHLTNVPIIPSQPNLPLRLSSSHPANTPIPSQPNPETRDALAPTFDELQLQKLWWLFEIMLLPHAYQDAHGKWRTKWSFHMGKGRVIPCQHPKFHKSVKERMDYTPLHYQPRAIYQHGREIFV